MQLVAFDARMGASGDMILGALLAAGADPAVLAPVEDTLNLQIEVNEDARAGISGTDVRVRPTDELPEGGAQNAGEEPETDAQNVGKEPEADVDEAGDGGGTHTYHHHEHDSVTAEHAGPHRSYEEVLEIVASMDLPAGVESDARAVFERLGRAEASVHGATLDEIHFHEVGADDAIADIVGAVLLFDDLDPDRVVTTPVATGGGTVEMSHGTYPVPAPAVVELAAEASWSIRGGPVDSELLTPTGAAILAHFAEGVERLPTMRVEDSGYGLGTKSFASHPNVLRAITGADTDGLSRDPVTVLETNLDDATPEELGGLQESLTSAGAHDVTILPATMKKSRPGHLVKVVVDPERVEEVARRLAEETGTLGIREHGRGHRWVADRDTTTVTVDLSGEPAEIDVKIARSGGEVFDVSAEFDDAQRVALDRDVPVRDVMRLAERAARDGLNSG